MKKIPLVVAVISLLSLLSLAFVVISHEQAFAQSSQSKPAFAQLSQPGITTFDTYKNKYPSFRMERTPSGILTVGMNTNGGPLVLSLSVRQDFPRVFHDIATDPGNEVVILTGSGGTWIKDVDFRSFGNVADPLVFKGTLTDLRRSLYNLLDIEVPVIAAIDGPAFINSHFALINDIVLASETAQFQDRPHIPSGLVPADGVQVVWEAIRFS